MIQARLCGFSCWALSVGRGFCSWPRRPLGKTIKKRTALKMTDKATGIVAWMTKESVDGKVKLEIGEATTNPAYVKAHSAWRWIPLRTATDVECTCGPYDGCYICCSKLS